MLHVFDGGTAASRSESHHCFAALDMWAWGGVNAATQQRNVLFVFCVHFYAAVGVLSFCSNFCDTPCSTKVKWLILLKAKSSGQWWEIRMWKKYIFFNVIEVKIHYL